MGYCMNQVDASFEMTCKDTKKALQAIKRLAGKETIHDSGGPHFSWVNHDFAARKTFKEIMDDWRWDVEADSDGNITGIYFQGEKLGDDMRLFEVIAPFVKDGSFIEMNGEDGCRWRWLFKNGECHEQTAKMVYED